MRAHPALSRLRALRNTYGEEAEREQRALLRSIRGLKLVTWRELEHLHEDLLFLCAFPASVSVRRLARAGLRAIPARMAALPRAQRSLADDSGIAGSTTRHVYPFPLARWLAHAFPRETEIDWRNVEEPAVLDPAIRPLLADA